MVNYLIKTGSKNAEESLSTTKLVALAIKDDPDAPDGAKAVTIRLPQVFKKLIELQTKALNYYLENVVKKEKHTLEN